MVQPVLDDSKINIGLTKPPAPTIHRQACLPTMSFFLYTGRLDVKSGAARAQGNRVNG